MQPAEHQMKTSVGAFVAAFFACISVSLAQESPTQSVEPNPRMESIPGHTPHHPDEISRLLEEWTPPNEEANASGSGDERGFLGHFLTKKAFAEIWTHYAAKLGIKDEYRPNFSTQLFPRLGPKVTDGHATLTIKNTEFPDQTERASTLTRREPSGRTITVSLVSQGEHTFVFVMIAPVK